MALVLRTLGKPTASGPLVRTVVYDGFDYAIRFAHHDSNAAILRSERYKARYIGANQHPAALRQHWRIARHVVDGAGEELIRELCAASQLNVDTELRGFRTRVHDAAEAVQPSAFTGDLKYTVYQLDRGASALVGSYHPAAVAMAKGMRAAYLAPMKAWKFAGTSPQMLRENLLSELSLAETQVTVLDGVYGIVDEAFAPQVGTEGVSIQTFNNAVPEFGSAA
jgi:hypothetical protein